MADTAVLHLEIFGPIVTALVTNPRLNIPNNVHQTLYQDLFEAHILGLRTWNTSGTCV